MMLKKNSKIFVAGHNGLVGSAIVRKLKAEGFNNLILKERKDLDLLITKNVNDFFASEKPEFVFLAAAKVGGILANKTYPADFIYQNLTIQNNIISAAHKYNVTKLLYLGSSCIYPKNAPQPIKEQYLLTGLLEETNIAYAIAKISGIIMCQSYNLQYKTNFISVMPTNLYGINDNFDVKTSHVLPAMIRKIHDAKINNKDSVVLWGTGTVKRELLNVDDLADALLFLMEKYEGSEIINIGTGEDITIKDLSELVKKIIKYKGEIKWDTTMPDGTPRKLLDVSKLNDLGWRHKIPLPAGIEKTYKWFLENYSQKNESSKN